MNDKTGLPEELDDDQIREWFESRDPNRKKIDPFLTDEARESVKGKSTPLVIKEDKEATEHGISFSQHSMHVRNVARHFFFFGSSVALVVAIILALIF